MSSVSIRSGSRIVVAGLFTAALLTALSCQNLQKTTVTWDTPPVQLVWPQPPDQPRIQWLGSIHSAADIGQSRAVGQGIVELVFGKKETDLVKPVAVAKNSAGLLVVADPGVPTVHFFDLAQKKYTRPKQKHSALLQSPVGVAVSDDGAVYVADSVSNEILVFNVKGELVSQFGKGILTRPTGLALNAAQDRLFAVDTVGNQVVTFDRAGGKLSAFGRRGNQPGEFNYPTYVATTPSGALCISDSLNFRVQTFQPDGTLVTSLGQAGDVAGSFTRPKGVASDSEGRFYIVDAAFENVQLFDTKGAFLLAFGGSGKGPGEFCLPAALHVDSTNTIWVADSFNQRVQVFRLLENSV
ncbi:MAG: 6-bladed beta-propeller [Candidatus Hydrogenedentes bacterium]|nr:6-bladed beta-propeller [Candidatus Hydrogenedentota bacterium]